MLVSQMDLLINEENTKKTQEIYHDITILVMETILSYLIGALITPHCKAPVCLLVFPIRTCIPSDQRPTFSISLTPETRAESYKEQTLRKYYLNIQINHFQSSIDFTVPKHSTYSMFGASGQRRKAASFSPCSDRCVK